MAKSTAPVNSEERSDETFLGRWSRRKQEERGPANRGPANRGPANRGPANRGSAPSIRSSEEPAPDDADMPPLETLDEHSDMSGFLSPRVSEELRKLALRKLFHLPKYQTRCILNEYEGNFNDFRPLGGVVTHEMRRMLELEARRRLAEAATAETGEAEPSSPARNPPTPATKSEPGPDPSAGGS